MMDRKDLDHGCSVFSVLAQGYGAWGQLSLAGSVHSSVPQPSPPFLTPNSASAGSPLSPQSRGTGGGGATLLQRHPLVLLATSLGSYAIPLTHRHMELCVLRSRLPPQNLQGHLRP